MSDYKPITGELRDAMRQWGWVERDGSITFTTSSMPPSIDAEQSLAISSSDFDRLCDAIDAIHAQLERENAELKVELDLVRGKQEEHAHTRGESIIDELREWFKDRIFMANGWQEIRDIADRIDAEHAKAIRELNNLADASVLLPVDADGEIIHVGDMMEHGKERGRVIALMLSEYPKKWGGGLHWGAQLEGEQAPTALDLTFHHYHAPTVEDVLREFARECLTYATCVDDHEVQDAIEMYAAKLREVLGK